MIQQQKSGSLVNLAKTKVILCGDTCYMCNGGWSQNEYEYTLEKSWSRIGEKSTNQIFEMDTKVLR